MSFAHEVTIEQDMTSYGHVYYTNPWHRSSANVETKPTTSHRRRVQFSLPDFKTFSEPSSTRRAAAYTTDRDDTQNFNPFRIQSLDEVRGQRHDTRYQRDHHNSGYDDILQELDDLQRSLNDPDLDLYGLESLESSKKELSTPVLFFPGPSYQRPDPNSGKSLTSPTSQDHAQTFTSAATRSAVYVTNLVVPCTKRALDDSTTPPVRDSDDVFVSKASITHSSNDDELEQDGVVKRERAKPSISERHTHKTALESKAQLLANATVGLFDWLFFPTSITGGKEGSFSAGTTNLNQKQLVSKDIAIPSTFRSSSPPDRQFPTTGLNDASTEANISPTSRLAAMQERAERKLSSEALVPGRNILDKIDGTFSSLSDNLTDSTVISHPPGDSLDFQDLESPKLLRSIQRRFGASDVTSAGDFPHARTPSIENLAHSIIEDIRKKSEKQGIIARSTSDC